MTLIGENDCAPVFDAYSAHKSVLVTSLPGTVVASFSATDHDLDDVIRYSITCVRPTNHDLPFTINSTTGKLRIRLSKTLYRSMICDDADVEDLW